MKRFESGAFDLPDNRTRSLNLRHHALEAVAWTGGGGLDVLDTREQLQLVANVPDTPAGNVALRDVASGLLNGFSIEFKSLSERRDDAGLRVLEKASLSAFGLVKIPSYPASKVEVRQGAVTVNTTIPSDTDMDCECSPGMCKRARIMAQAMNDMFQSVFEQFERETIATYASYNRPLASVGKGTLRGRMVQDDLEVEIDLPNSEAGRAVAEAHEAAGVVVRPFLDANLSTAEEVGDLAIYSNVAVRAFIVSSTDARAGWPVAKLIPTPGQRAELVTPKRRRIWL